MTERLCVDASVAVKAALPEQHSALAISLLGEAIAAGISLVAPLHFEVEVASAIYKRRRDGMITAEEAHERYETVAALPVQPLSVPGLAHTALEIAAELDQRYPHDAFYLAVGELLGCDVWTADERFHAAAAARYPRLRLLAEFVPVDRR